jgi:hypothetical protein
MSTPLYKSDIKRPSQRTILTEVDNADYFVFEDVNDSKLKAITKTNIKETLGINANSTAISTLNTNKEDKSNKVTAFQPTPDDTHYPSEKLVGDSLKAIKGVDYTKGTLKSHEDALATLNADDTTEGSVAKSVKDAVEPVKGTGWNGETIKGVSDNLDAHLASSMPHVFRNHEKGKNYNFGFRVSNDGHPQIIFEEEV